MKTLVIDDNDQNFYLERYLLESVGHTVTASRDGAQAFTILETMQPDIILLDIQLPGLDGNLIAKSQQNHALDQVAIVTITSYALDGDRPRALAAGCDNYLTKPIGPDTFTPQIEEFFDSKLHSNRTNT